MKTENKKCTYMVRPVTFRDYGVYKVIGENRAKVIYEGTMDACYEELNRLKWEDLKARV